MRAWITLGVLVVGLMSLGEGRPVLSRSFERAWGLESQRDGGLARLVVAISDEEDRRGLVGVPCGLAPKGSPK